jgi:hypothetical protein
VVVVIALSTGERHRVDRRERLDIVTEVVNGARGQGKLISLPNDATPSRKFSVDPDAVVSITDDGYTH